MQRNRLFEDEARLEALCSLLRRYGVPLTCFIVMKHAACYAQPLASLAQATEVEFAIHSYSHDTRAPATREEVKRSWNVYCELWNKEPRGYRSPVCIIDTEGLRNIANQGFLYDSSVAPTLRLDAYGYNNLHLPTTPFRFQLPGRQILELPIACFGGIRVPLILSYVKLLGLTATRAASRLLSLPDVVVVYFHPYDLYIMDIVQNIPGWKKYAHLCNARNGLLLLEGIIAMLKERGYQFVLMERAAEQAKWNSLPVLSSLDAKQRNAQRWFV